MNGSKRNVQFLPLVSQPNPTITWLLRIFFIPIIALIPILIYALPAILIMESPFFFYSQTEEIIFLIVSYGILMGLSWFIFQYFRKISSRAVTQIEVNETGVQYKHYNGTTSAVLYQDLTYSGNPYIKDIYSKSMRKGPTLLKVFWRHPETGKTTERSISFDTDIVYGQYTGNRSNLIGRFILGVRLFRSDLTVCDSVYSNFYIHKDTHSFHKRDYIKVWTVGTAMVFIIVYLIYLYTAYRFGN